MREDFYPEYYEVEGRHWWFRGRAAVVTSVIASLEQRPPAGGELRILDFGTGTGSMLSQLRRFGDAQGVDADEQAIAFCRARGEERVQRLETDELPFADDSFDLLTTLDVLEHIGDDVGALREVARVLAPGGRMVATVPANPWMWGAQDEVSHHFRRYTKSGLRTAIAAGGLELERITHFNTLLFPPIAAIRLLRRLRPADGEAQSDFGMPGGEGSLNRLLAGVFGLEARLLRRANLPFGVSLLAVARAPR
jgi:SAM-dependent methyltransferase